MKIEYRDYTKDDYNFVYNVKKISYQKYVEENFGGWDDDVQHEMFEKFLEVSGKDIKIIMLGDEKIGFLNGNDTPDGYEQGNICILPEWQGKGIGTKILKDIIEEHKNQNIYLRVFKSNPAKALYERLGFKTYEESKSHYRMQRQFDKNKTLN